MAGQVWVKNEYGAYYASPKLSKELRYASQALLKFRPYARKVNGFGKKQGDTVDFNKITNVESEGREVLETERTPETRYKIRRGQAKVKEFMNSVPYTEKLEDLSEFNVENDVMKTLRDDMVKVFDKNVAAAFKKSKVLYIPTGATGGVWDVDGTPSTTASSNATIFHIKEIVDALRTGDYRNAGTQVLSTNPCNPYTGPDGDFIGIFSIRAVRGVIDDPEFQDVNTYIPKTQKALNGEVGRIYGVRIVQTNHLGALSNAKGTNNVLGEAVIFGNDPVVEIVAAPEELRAKVGEDYGRDQGIAWRFMGNWEIVWQDPATETENRIVYVTSA